MKLFPLVIGFACVMWCQAISAHTAVAIIEDPPCYRLVTHLLTRPRLQRTVTRTVTRSRTRPLLRRGLLGLPTGCAGVQSSASGCAGVQMAAPVIVQPRVTAPPAAANCPTGT